MLNRDPYELITLPVELLFEIYSHLSPEEASLTRRANKSTRNILQAGSFWKRKYLKHFPHLYEALKAKPDVNWFVMFGKTYNDEYSCLRPDFKKIFSLVKEADVERLKALNPDLKFSDLCRVDKNGFNLVYWAQQTGNQALLDYFYRIATQYYSYRAGLILYPKKTDPWNRTILHWAIFCHQPAATVNSLIKQGVDIHAVINTQTPLMLAAQKGQAEMADLLIRKGAHINACSSSSGATALLFAVEHHKKNVVDVLLRHNACTTIPLQVNMDYHAKLKVVEGDTPLFAAIKPGHIDIVKALLEKGVAIDALINGATALMLAAETDQTEIAELLIQHGANINARNPDGATALLIATKNNSKNVVKVLLRHKADTTLPIELSSDDHTRFRVFAGDTPLFVAIKLGHLHLVKALLDKNPAINTLVNDCTALMLAAKEGRSEIAAFLISRGADVNARNACGATALLFAVADSNTCLVDLLLGSHADATIPLRTEGHYHCRFIKILAGDTPLHVAARSANTALVRRLIDNQANHEALNSQQQTPCDVVPKTSACFHELRLLRCEANLNRLPDNHKKSITFFGHSFKFGHPAKQDKDAARALKSVVFHGASRSCLHPHKNALKQDDELKSICRGLHIVC